MKLGLRSEDLTWNQIDDEIVVLDGRKAEYLAVTGAGALLWRMLAAHATREELVDAMLHAYEVDQVRAADDTDAFLRKLREQELLAA
jgi:hypothetical protein